MDEDGAERFTERAEAALPGADLPLLHRLHRFTRQRLESARESAAALDEAADAAGRQDIVHRFLRDCYDGLDGLAREVNLCMHRLFPDAGLYPPHRMTRQCGLYMVRKILRESPEASSHPVTIHLWCHTREPADSTYERLSFLYNLAIFVPVPLLDGGTKLPGNDDLPEELQPFARDREIRRCGVGEGVEEMLGWTEEFIGGAYGPLAEALDEELSGGERKK